MVASWVSCMNWKRPGILEKYSQYRVSSSKGHFLSLTFLWHRFLPFSSCIKQKFNFIGIFTGIFSTFLPLRKTANYRVCEWHTLAFGNFLKYWIVKLFHLCKNHTVQQMKVGTVISITWIWPCKLKITGLRMVHASFGLKWDHAFPLRCDQMTFWIRIKVLFFYQLYFIIPVKDYQVLLMVFLNLFNSPNTILC